MAPLVGGAPRIGLLEYGFDRPLSGTTRATLQLATALIELPDLELFHLTTSRASPFSGVAQRRSWRLPGTSRLPGLMGLGGPAIALAALRLGLDLVHDPVGVSPFTLGRWAGRFKRVVTIHDAIAFRYAEGYPWLNNFLHRHFVPRTLANVDRVITVSEHAKQDLVHFLALSPDRIDVVQNSIADQFRPVSEQAARDVAARYGLSRPYVLSVGTQQARKNLRRLVLAFCELRRRFPQYRLAIAGPHQWDYGGVEEAIEAAGARDAVTRLGYVADADLPGIYSAADLFVFPSLYEGFGIPVLEAMACGTPVVCADAGALPEVAGDAALLADPLDTAALAEAMERVIADRDVADALRRRGLTRAREFTPHRTARATAAVYRRALEET